MMVGQVGVEISMKNETESSHHVHHASPERSPHQKSHSLAAAATAAAVATLTEPQSRFARKEPRAQDLREYDGTAWITHWPTPLPMSRNELAGPSRRAGSMDDCEPLRNDSSL